MTVMQDNHKVTPHPPPLKNPPSKNSRAPRSSSPMATMLMLLASSVGRRRLSLTAPSRHNSHPNRRMKSSTVVFSDQKDSTATTWQREVGGRGGGGGGRGREAGWRGTKIREGGMEGGENLQLGCDQTGCITYILHSSNFNKEHSPHLPDLRDHGRHYSHHTLCWRLCSLRDTQRVAT